MDMSGFRNRFALRGEVGNGRDNDPGDVLAVKRRLNGLGLYDEPDYGFTGYIDRATEDGIKNFQKKSGLKIDGWLAPGGETEAAISDLVDRHYGQPVPIDQAVLKLPYFIEGEVGNGRTNNEDDVRGIRQLLTNVGYTGARGDSPFIDRDLSNAITTFQRDNDLKQDGWLAPGGKTEQALQQTFSTQGSENLLGGTDNDTLATAAERIREDIPGKSSQSKPAARNLLEEAPSPVSSSNQKSVQVAQNGDLALPRPLIDFFTVGIPALLGMQALRDKNNPPGTTWKANPSAPEDRSENNSSVVEPHDNSESFGSWLDRQFNAVFSKSHGGSRGDDSTQKGNRILAQQCVKVMTEELSEGVTGEHEFGSYENGDGDYLKEEVIRDPANENLKGGAKLKNSRRSDLTLKVTIGDVIRRLRLQNMTMGPDGQPIQREVDALKDLRRLTNQLVEGMRKLRPGDDEEEYRDEATDFCRRVLGEYMKEPQQPGNEGKTNVPD